MLLIISLLITSLAPFIAVSLITDSPVGKTNRVSASGVCLLKDFQNSEMI